MENQILITKSLEDYLETMHILQHKKGEIRITDIADLMQVSKPSVNKAVLILKKANLINHQPYGKIEITKRGNTLAKNIYLRHETLLKFLKEKLGVEEKIAQEEACKIEHVISEQTLQKLIEYIKT